MASKIRMSAEVVTRPRLRKRRVARFVCAAGANSGRVVVRQLKRRTLELKNETAVFSVF